MESAPDAATLGTAWVEEEDAEEDGGDGGGGGAVDRHAAAASMIPTNGLGMDHLAPPPPRSKQQLITKAVGPAKKLAGSEAMIACVLAATCTGQPTACELSC